MVALVLGLVFFFLGLAVAAAAVIFPDTRGLWELIFTFSVGGFIGSLISGVLLLVLRLFRRKPGPAAPGAINFYGPVNQVVVGGNEPAPTVPVPAAPAPAPQNPPVAAKPEVRIADEPMTNSVIHGRHYENVTIVGPAILVPLGATRFQGNAFEGEIDGLLWPFPKAPMVYGPIGVEDCEFIGCVFQGVGIAGPPKLLKRFRNDLTKRGGR